MPYDPSSASQDSQAKSPSLARTQTRTLEDGSALLRQALDELASRAVVHVSTNARGRAQFDLRLPYASINDATNQVEADIASLITTIRTALTASGLLLAGDDEDGVGRVGSTGSTGSPVQTKRSSSIGGGAEQ